MKYRIKNPEVEKAVRGLFKNQEGFERMFNEACKHYFNFNQNFVKVYATGDYTVSGCWIEVGVDKSDIEEMIKYNPKKWNEFPKVKPPKKGLYRVEYTTGNYQWRSCLFWAGERWVTENTFNQISTINTNNWKFKPWDDEEDEE